MEGVIFRSYGDDFVNLAQLGSHLFARGALSTITTLEFDGTYFEGAVMTNLMNGLERSGHNVRTIRRLKFTRCTTSYDDKDELILDDVEEVFLTLIAGLGAGIFSNLQELLVQVSPLMAREVPELVKVLRGGAPCARTLRTVVLSGCLEWGPIDLAALQAALPQATVTCY